MYEKYKHTLIPLLHRAFLFLMSVAQSLWLELNWLVLRGLWLMTAIQIARAQRRRGNEPTPTADTHPRGQLAPLIERRNAVNTSLSRLISRQEASKHELGLHPHFVGLAAGGLILLSLIMHNRAVKSSVDTSRYPLASDSSASLGSMIAPQVMTGMRFSDQMIELLKADIMSGNIVPQTENLDHSTDDRIRQILALEREIAETTSKAAELERNAPQLAQRIDAESTAFMLANTTRYSWIVQDGNVRPENTPNARQFGRNWEHEDGTMTWAPGAEEKYKAMFEPLRKAKAEMIELPYRRKLAMQKLEPLLREVAASTARAGQSPNAFGVSLGETADTVGYLVITNRGGATFHHCMVVAHGEESHEASFASPLLGALDQAVRHSDRMSDEEAAQVSLEDKAEGMPEVSVAYRESFAPGDRLLLPACTSKNITGLTVVTASIWADETTSENVTANNFDRHREIASNLHEKETSAESQESAVDQQTKQTQATFDLMAAQRKSVQVATADDSITYRLLVYPNVDCECVVAPADMKQIDVAFDPASQFSYYTDPGNHSAPCKPHSVLHFSAYQGDPVVVLVRFLTRDYKAGEQPFTMASWPSGFAPTLTETQQKNHQAILSALTKKAVLKGLCSESDGAQAAITVHLTPVLNSDVISGWIAFDKPAVKIAVDGRIIDDPNQGTLLQLIENSVLEGGSYFRSDDKRPFGRVYEFRLDSNDESNRFKATWTFRDTIGVSTERFDQGTAQIQ